MPTKIQLPYYNFWTNSTTQVGFANGTRVYFSLIALCLPGNYLSGKETEVSGFTNIQTDSGSSGYGLGSCTFKLTPVLLRMNDTYLSKWIEAEDDYPAAGVHYVTVRNIKFNIIKTFKLSKNDEDWSEYEKLSPGMYDSYVTEYSGSSNTVTLDLTYLVYNEGKANQFLKLVSATNIKIGSTTYPDTVTATSFIDDIWDHLMERDPSVVGKIFRYMSDDLALDRGADIVLNGVGIGNLLDYTEYPQRCNTRKYSADRDVTADRSDAYIFDFTSEWIIQTLQPNQKVTVTLAYATDEHEVTDTMFFDNTVVFDNQSNNYAVINSKLERNFVHVIPDFYNSEYGFEQWNIIHNGEDVDVNMRYVDADALVEAYKYYIEMSPGFITPMEYYANNSTVDAKYEGKLENITNIVTEPVYFWVETLKNWCTYTVYKASDACTGAELCIWNGFDDFIPLYKYIDTVNKEVPTLDVLEDIAEEFQRVGWNGLTPENKTILLNAYQQLDLRSMQFRGFDFNRLKTVDIIRAAKYATADYEGKPKKSWLDYLGPIGSVIRFANHTWGAFLNITPVYWVYNAIANDMTPWDSIKAAGNHAKAAGCAALMAVVQVIGTITLTAGPATYAKFQMDCAEAYNRLLGRLPSHENMYELDHWQNLFAVCRYVMCPYDENYSSSDKTTFQTIRNTITPEKFYHVSGAFKNRNRLIPYHLIPNPIGAMFAARGSTGELMLAMTFMLSGPTREDEDGHSDFPKYSGVTESDIDFANELLRTQLGAGYDKTGGHYMNFTGAVDDLARDPEFVDTLKTRLTNAQVLQENAKNKTVFADLHLTAHRSKTSSDADTNSINTLTKW